PTSRVASAISLVVLHVDDLDKVFALQDLVHCGSKAGAYRTSLPEPLGQVEVSPDGCDSEQLTIDAAELPTIRIAQAYRLLQDRVEYRGEIAGRAVDDLQYLGGGGLLLQGLARLTQEPRVLHRNDRLRGEILQQCDLLVGERPHLFAIKSK